MPLYFHTDACQAANYLDVHVDRLGVDLMTLNGGKIYGPKQSGVLYIKSNVALSPQILGGGQERNIRSGTEQVPGIIGFGKALQKAQEIRHQESERLAKLQQQFVSGLQTAVPAVIVNGSSKYRLPSNVHITLPGQDNERLLFGLDEAGIVAAAGSACSASNEEPSHVLRAMGIRDADAQASLRMTMGRDTNAKMVQEAIAALLQLTSTK
jgi:cysteine desulfurase